jgi:hypothetical protein
MEVVADEVTNVASLASGSRRKNVQSIKGRTFPGKILAQVECPTDVGMVAHRRQRPGMSREPGNFRKDVQIDSQKTLMNLGDELQRLSQAYVIQIICCFNRFFQLPANLPAESLSILSSTKQQVLALELPITPGHTFAQLVQGRD